jgi:RimJ/RimL family protein N-acetyltransferase
VIFVPLGGGEGEYEVGWHFHPDSWGQGLATESARGALQWARQTLGLTEVFAVVYAGNDPSMAVCRRLGMEHLGPTKKYYDTELELFRVDL